MFYPLGFLYYLFPPHIAYGYTTVLHWVLGSMFMYAFMRSLSVSAAGSFISVVIFSFNGYFMGHLYAGHLTFVQSYIWLPLIFHLFYLFMRDFNLKYAIPAGLILGVQILGGFPQLTFYTILGCMMFGLFRGFVFVREGKYQRTVILFAGVVGMLFVGFAAAAVQILPTMEFTRLSTRAGGIDYAFATYDSLNPRDVLAFLVPNIFGSPVDGTYWPSRETWHFWESCGYVGIFPLFLVFVKGASRSIRKLRIFFLLLIAFSLFLAFGRHNPFYHMIYRLPGFHSFRIPAQILFLYVFSVSVLSGIGWSNLEEGNWHLSRGPVIFLAIVGGLLLFLVSGLTFSPYDFFFRLFKNFSDGPLSHVNIDGLYNRISFSIRKSVLLFFGSVLVIATIKHRLVRRRQAFIICCSLLLTDLFIFGQPFIKSYEFKTSHKKPVSYTHLTLPTN